MLNKVEPSNLGTILCYSSRKYIIIERNEARYKTNKNQQYLVINRTSGDIKVQNNVNTQKMIKRTFSAFFGIVDFEGEKFVLFCDEAKVSCSVSKLTIFQIHSLFFLGFKQEQTLKKLPERAQIFRKIRDINVLLETGFYFSNEYNLTRTLEYQKLSPSNNFIWNYKFLREIKQFPAWKTPIIQGYVSFYEIFVQGTKIFYILISRRSIQKCGTRYFDRGINDQGFVANFVETEQIIKINQYLISDIQIRGNVPVFFEQKGLTTKIKITRGYQLTHQCYLKHMSVIKKYYERIFWVNLLSVHKNGQKTLIKQTQKHIQQSKDKDLKYLYYDFHHEVRGGHFQKVDEIIKKLREMKSNLKFYIYDTKNDKVLMRQQGVFRTNCLDCLDRTNFFQAKLAIITMEQILSCFQIKFQKPLLEQMNDSENNSSQVIHFRKIWADNGDMISYHYTGTGSTHTDIIRDGKRGMFGGIKHKYKSVSRFYNQNFWDFYKMNSIDLLLDEEKSQVQNRTIPNLIRQRQAQFCEKKMINLYIFTWKAPKKAPPSITLFPNYSDLLAISIQQISQQDKWIQLVNQAVDQNHYLPIARKISNNNMLVIFAKKSLKDYISNVQVTKVKFKSMYNQYLSSKCAVLIRCTIFSNKVTFIGCQLQFGRQYASNRIQNLRDLHKYAFQQMQVGQKMSQSIVNDDVIFLFGNTNTNISSGFKEVIPQFNDCVIKGQKISLQQRRLIDQMIDSGEFSGIQQNLMQFRFYEQEPIKFPPTYKFSKSKGCFDPEVSGWPDRIWYSTQKKIICCSYGTVEQMRFEHVPVYANYQLQLDDINEDARISVSEQIFCRVSESRGYLQDPVQEQQQQQLLQKDERQATRVLDPL